MRVRKTASLLTKLTKYSFIPVSLLLLINLSAFLLPSCNSDYTPKPRGYFRIALPEKKYNLLDSIYPYAFEYPAYAKITNDPLSPKEVNWINVEMPVFHGRIHISYKILTDNKSLVSFTEDSRTLALKHMAKASGIRQIAINDPKRRVFGLVYEINGMGAASPYQFYLTDSTRNFLRGSLYFDAIPNNDSLAPVIDYVRTDIQHMFETFNWK
ncbi:MAG: gliding motility lipoprotein GldD [Bacteroidota bacterium]